MIFATVGMHNIGFERLIKALDLFAESNPDQKMLIQIGSSRYIPKFAEYYTFKPDIQQDIENASIIITHGSICFLDAIRLGKKVIAVPRKPELGEVMNHHQIKTCEVFSKRFGFSVIDNIDDLKREIDILLSQGPATAFNFMPTGLHNSLKIYLESINRESLL